MNLTSHLRVLPAAVLFSLNRYLYVLDRATYAIKASFEQPGTILFEVVGDYLVLSDETSKIVTFCALDDVI